MKPANVLLGSNRDVKVADLGIASVSDRTQITTSGSIIGSLGYMAPEQMHEAPATPAIDIYALAAVAYETLSGQRRAANQIRSRSPTRWRTSHPRTCARSGPSARGGGRLARAGDGP